MNELRDGKMAGGILRLAVPDCKCAVCVSLRDGGRMPPQDPPWGAAASKTAVEVVLAEGPWWQDRRGDPHWMAQVFALMFVRRIPAVEIRATNEALFVKVLLPAGDMPLERVRGLMAQLRDEISNA